MKKEPIIDAAGRKTLNWDNIWNLEKGDILYESDIWGFGEVYKVKKIHEQGRGEVSVFTIENTDTKEIFTLKGEKFIYENWMFKKK